MNPLIRLQTWLNGKYPLSKTRVLLVDAQPSDLTLNEWTKHIELTHEAYTMAQTPIFKSMIEVLKNESPANYKMPKGSQPTDLVVHLGEIDGYNMAINNMLAMTVQHEKLEPLVASFEAEKEQTL